MREMRVKTWAEFEEQATAKIQRMVECQSKKKNNVDSVLFRGQGNSIWGLTTTLQRAMGKNEETAANYHRWMKIVHKDITSFLDRDWDTDVSLHLGAFEVMGIEFMVYLRQNGFPSPLLDWTRSPYIAAYFAFRDVGTHAGHPEYVAIYSCGTVEHDDIECEFSDVDGPSVQSIGPCLATDKKHHLQQCEYTLCARRERDDYHFAEYPDEISRLDTRPCVFEKHIIPFGEQEEVLRRLQLMNITAFSLFGTEAALMESLAVRELFLRGRD